jgi:predicted component of type VI protein secretion system
VQDPWVSRLHCEIEDADGKICVRDLGSKHGVFLNGLRVTYAQLNPGDRLTLGTTCFCVCRTDGPRLAKIAGKVRNAARRIWPWRQLDSREGIEN